MENTNVPICKLAKDERPREKLQEKGIAALSTSELLAILLRSGIHGESALALSRQILNDCGNRLSELARWNVDAMMKRYHGVGIAKAASLVVAMELGRRRAVEIAKVVTIHSSSQLFEYVSPWLQDLEYEEFWVVFLNRGNRILGYEKLFMGGMSGTVVDVRILFRRALEMKCSAIIVIHNHPSGTLHPSEYDKQVTTRIREGGKLLDIALYDHIIVSGVSYFSFLDEGLLF
ncbi:MAG: DNA repair protein RadC [Culturomica sp.]|jgi:DNA repair protein RadC|nr:DNA repair protein RadC [Culturomica sp.]